MIKNLNLVFVLIMSAFTLKAQQFNSGLTNKLIVKTDAVYWLTGNAINAEIEYRLKNNFTLTAGFYLGSKQYPQVYYYNQYAKSEQDFLSTPSPIILPDKGTINCTLYRLGARYYTNNIIKAPFGPYFVFNVGYGKADMGGEYDEWLFDQTVTISGSKSGPITPYAYFNVPVINGQLGWGMQFILFRKITLDGCLCYDYSDFISADSKSGKIMSGVTGNFGPGLNLGGGSSFDLMIKAGIVIF